jgi:hypothetical protein
MNKRGNVHARMLEPRPSVAMNKTASFVNAGVLSPSEFGELKAH